MKGESEKVNALAIGAASFASTSKDKADSAAQRETPKLPDVNDEIIAYAGDGSGISISFTPMEGFSDSGETKFANTEILWPKQLIK